jgi:DNA replication protein DnaC
MERLNDFMNHSAMRRPANPAREQQQSVPEQFSPQPPAPIRRPLPEQRPPEQRPPYTAPAPRTSHRRFTNSARPEQAISRPTTPPVSYGRKTVPNSGSPLSPESLANYGASTYQQYREDEPDAQYAPNYNNLSQQHYYHNTDDAIPIIEADVLDEEQFEAEEDEVNHVQASRPHWQNVDYESQEQYLYNNAEPSADTLATHKANYDINHSRGRYQQKAPESRRNSRYPDQGERSPGPASLPNRGGENSLPPHTKGERFLTTPEPAPLPNHGGENSLSPRTTRQLGSKQRPTILSPGRNSVNTAPLQQHVVQQQVTKQETIRPPSRLPDVGTFISPMAKPTCPKCRGAGYLRADVPFGHPNFGKPMACECKEAERKAKRRMQLREMSNMDAFQDSSFDTFHPYTPGVREAYEASVRYAAEPRGWLVMIGPNGCGKTHLAAAIANTCLEDGAVVLFAVVPDLLDHLRAAFAPTATEMYDQLFSKMREAEILVLDDLGAQQSSPWANEKLFQLLNYRYNLEMPTVVTANPKGFQGMDERIRSRLGDVGLAETINFNYAKDYRPNHARPGRG